jgi:hypothetical protein
MAALGAGSKFHQMARVAKGGTMFEAPKRRADRVFIHCSATDAASGVDGDNRRVEMVGEEMVKVVRHWHRQRKFSDVGYHFLIDKEGSVMDGRSLEKTPAAQRGHNTGTIAIMVHGLHDFKHASLDALKELCHEINLAYSGRVSFHGHCEVSAKSCPVFDYQELLGLDRFGRMP